MPALLLVLMVAYCFLLLGFILQAEQQYIVLPFILTICVLVLVFLVVSGIVLQTGHIITVVLTVLVLFVVLLLVAGAAEATRPRAPRDRLQATSAVNFLIGPSLESPNISITITVPQGVCHEFAIFAFLPPA
jgi:hypothetical protein